MAKQSEHISDELNIPENFNIGKNIFFTIITIILFLFLVVVYGIILNLRDVPLKEIIESKYRNTQLENINILIDKKSFTLFLYSNNELLKKYRASFGKNLSEEKENSIDKITPIGVYSICEIIDKHKYHKFFRLNYPNYSDAVDAYRKGHITINEFNTLMKDLQDGNCPSSNTILGGNIGIHGNGRFNFFLKNLPFVFNWTNGSIAIANEHIDELYSIIKKGTKVVIK